MGYEWSGSDSITVEVRWIADTDTYTEDATGDDRFGRFKRGIDEIVGAMLLPITAGSQPQDAFAGQAQDTHLIRIEGPPMTILAAMLKLRELCEACFPRVRED